MRSFFIYFKDKSPEQVKEYLSETLEPSQTQSYDFTIMGKNYPWAYIHVDGIIDDMGDEDIDAVLKALQSDITAIIQGDISGRKLYIDEALGLVSKVLAENECVAQDDYSEFVWNSDSIRTVNTEGRRFFRDLSKP